MQKNQKRGHRRVASRDWSHSCTAEENKTKKTAANENDAVLWVGDFLPGSTRDPETNVVTPENGWLEVGIRLFSFGFRPVFQGRTVSFKECKQEGKVGLCSMVMSNKVRVEHQPVAVFYPKPWRNDPDVFPHICLQTGGGKNPED